MGIDVAAAWDQVIAAISAAFPAFNVQAGEDPSEDAIATPAILVDLVEIEPTEERDPTTGEIAALMRFEARVLRSYREPRARRVVASDAAALAAFLHNERLGVRWGAAQVFTVAPDEFNPRADQYRAWLVEWAHLANIGDQVDQGDGQAASEVLSSFAPDIGSGNEDDYDTVAP
ncbi:hypothetical protein GCM10016455_05540 [Aliiroseovarius zhejiangensis]|uniref:Uncharacterized protein n=1 Tax=Aliiroseovarius zhejiangensis TaxID=1632025 RepID=A0ABQ3IQW6_9RHOB|nr:hypothetical protein [Aliiroseovarius zhejiangensis]GHE88297.1 hypothetical protein GCM10016455_05540 [Aliiroseovarius zhejiangensis]